ncbi:19494_t:CDS:2 [Funneliformis geosporum]|uniref:18286_t:CDS:1 n=1 Tax=Funneliformis geosporum TaxID=1117311 RepID=A0A9W4SZJ6_9GLOM|nr:18286_t:CDS:2 [Funneliformis geosporum]CAI2187427.1 19494_t:CDS:2 [Funneliformis geosporum]
MSKSFSVSDPTWTIRSVGPSVAYHTLSIGGSQNDLLILCGGEYFNPVPENPLFYFNTSEQSPEWINIRLILKPLREHTVVTRLSDSMNYIYGGIDTNDPEVSAKVQLNDLLKFDTRQNLLNDLSVDPKLPPGRFHQTATILPDGKMYVIGGFSIDKLVEMSQIYVYDTINGVWDDVQQTVGGALPLARRDHVAVGTQDGRVIIHGGVNVDYSKPYNDIAILDTTIQPFTWFIPEVKGNVPPARYSHTATMVGTSMLIAFGVLSSSEKGDILDDNIYIFDTATYVWKDNFIPTTTPSPSPSPSPTSLPPSKLGLIIGFTLGVIILLLLVSFGLYRLYRRRNKKLPYMTEEQASNQVHTDEQTSNQVKKFLCI